MSRLGARFDAGESFVAEFGCAVAMIAFVGTIAFLALALPGCSEPFTTDLFGDSSAQGGAGGASDGSTASDGGAGSAGGAASTGQAISSVGQGAAGSGGVGDGGGSRGVAGNATGVGGDGGQGAACGPTTCAGCCDSSGTCQLGSVDAACGFGGEACSACVDSCGYDASQDLPNSQCGYPGVGVQHWECAAFACVKKQDGDGYTGSCCPSPTCSNGACQ